MNTFTAHLKRDQSPVLLPEGWSWGCFLFGPVALLAQRAWIPALLEIAGLILLLGLAPPHLYGPALLGLAFINGLLGRDFVRWSLQRQGYVLSHVVIAANRDAAFLRLFTARPDLMEAER